MRTTRSLAALTLLLAGLAGCARKGTSPPADAPLPTISRPTGPPENPTDQIKPPSWVVGTVTAGGSGPCYGLSTDDGTAYALHAADGTVLVKGARMRIAIKPAVARIGCGPGKLVEMTAAEPLR
jgi:predicted small lipoprotein YifL